MLEAEISSFHCPWSFFNPFEYSWWSTEFYVTSTRRLKREVHFCGGVLEHFSVGCLQYLTFRSSDWRRDCFYFQLLPKTFNLRPFPASQDKNCMSYEFLEILEKVEYLPYLPLFYNQKYKLSESSNFINLYIIVLANCIKNSMDTQIMYKNKVFQYFCSHFV